MRVSNVLSRSPGHAPGFSFFRDYLSRFLWGSSAAVGLALGCKLAEVVWSSLRERSLSAPGSQDRSRRRKEQIVCESERGLKKLPRSFRATLRQGCGGENRLGLSNHSAERLQAGALRHAFTLAKYERSLFTRSTHL